jgi:hypothetical protein
MRVVGQESE